MSLSLERYLGQHAADAITGECTNQIILAACLTVEKARRLLTLFGQDRAQVSGWRPHKTNAATPRASPYSKHLTGEAIDLADPDGQLDAWCNSHQQHLTSCGLYLEAPNSTPGWCHLQTVAPPSGHRVFFI